MYFLFVVLLLLAKVPSAASQLQPNCQYKVTGDALKRNEKRSTEADGSQWKMGMKNGKETLELKFNGSVIVYEISIRLRLRHNRIVRITSHHVDGNVVHDLFNIVGGRNNAFVNEVRQRPTSDKLTLQGFFIPIKEDEIDTIKIIACPADCRGPPPCYGNCELAVKDGCMDCLCPKDSLSRGCSGFNGNRQLRLLRELARRKTRGCQFVRGYGRHQNKITGTDECVPINYARCDWYLQVVMPRTFAECIQHCY